MCQFEVEWEKFLCVWENVLCNAITLIEIKSVDPASGQNRDKIVSLLLTFFFSIFFWEHFVEEEKNKYLCQLSSSDHKEAQSVEKSVESVESSLNWMISPSRCLGSFHVLPCK